MKSQSVVTEWFKVHGWPWAVSTGAGRSGVDIENMPGLAAEVKARRGWDLTGWSRQAARNAKGALPFVVVRPDGYGPKTIGLWPVIIPLARFTELLTDAGYGSGPTEEDDVDGGKGAAEQADGEGDDQHELEHSPEVVEEAVHPATVRVQ